MLSFNKLPLGFLLTLSLVLSFEFFNSSLDNYFYSPSVEGIATPFEGLRLKIKNDVSRSGEDDFDVVIVGDSNSHVSIIPGVIEEETGLSSFNFSTYGAQGTIGSYWLFRNLINAGHEPPDYLVVGFSPFLTDVYPNEFPDNALTNLFDLRKGNIAVFFEEFGVAKGIKFLFPSLKHQGRFKEFLKSPLSFEIPDKAQLSGFIEQVHMDKGHYPERADESYPKESKMSGYEKFFDYVDLDHFYMAPFYSKYFRKMLDLAEANDVTIILYVPVIASYLYSEIEGADSLKQYDEFIDKLKKEYKDLYIVKAQNAVNEDDMYMDIYHLNAKGGAVLSSYLSDAINDIEKKPVIE